MRKAWNRFRHGKREEIDRRRLAQIAQENQDVEEEEVENQGVEEEEVANQDAAEVFQKRPLPAIPAAEDEYGNMKGSVQMPDPDPNYAALGTKFNEPSFYAKPEERRTVAAIKARKNQQQEEFYALASGGPKYQSATQEAGPVYAAASASAQPVYSLAAGKNAEENPQPEGFYDMADPKAVAPYNPTYSLGSAPPIRGGVPRYEAASKTQPQEPEYSLASGAASSNYENPQTSNPDAAENAKIAKNFATALRTQGITGFVFNQKLLTGSNYPYLKDFLGNIKDEFAASNGKRAISIFVLTRDSEADFKKKIGNEYGFTPCFYGEAAQEYTKRQQKNGDKVWEEQIFRFKAQALNAALSTPENIRNKPEALFYHDGKSEERGSSSENFAKEVKKMPYTEGFVLGTVKIVCDTTQDNVILHPKTIENFTRHLDKQPAPSPSRAGAATSENYQQLDGSAAKEDLYQSVI